MVKTSVRGVVYDPKKQTNPYWFPIQKHGITKYYCYSTLQAAVDAKRGDIPCTHLEKLEELASVKAEPNLQVAPAEARVLQIKESLGPNNVFRICKPKAERRAGCGSIAAGHATSTTTALSSRIVQQADGRGQSTAARWATKVTNETS